MNFKRGIWARTWRNGATRGLALAVVLTLVADPVTATSFTCFNEWPLASSRAAFSPDIFAAQALNPFVLYVGRVIIRSHRFFAATQFPINHIRRIPGRWRRELPAAWNESLVHVNIAQWIVIHQNKTIRDWVDRIIA